MSCRYLSMAKLVQFGANILFLVPFMQAAKAQTSLHIALVSLSHHCSTILIPFMQAGKAQTSQHISQVGVSQIFVLLKQADTPDHELSLIDNDEVGTVLG